VRIAGLGRAVKNQTPGLPSVVSGILPGSALSGVFGTMVGGPVLGLGSAALDFAVSYPLTKLARAARPPKQSTTNFVRDSAGKLTPALEPSRLEGAANIGGMILSSQLGGSLLPFGPAVEPTVNSQEQTLMHQMMQRQEINNLQTPQAVSPGTQFQMAGIEFLNDYLTPQVSETALPVPARIATLLKQTGMDLGL
jgi:hypothetical protein